MLFYQLFWVLITPCYWVERIDRRREGVPESAPLAIPAETVQLLLALYARFWGYDTFEIRLPSAPPSAP